WCAASGSLASASGMPQRHGGGAAPQQGGGKGVDVPAQIRRQPFQDLESALPMLALEPVDRHIRDLPAQPVRLHQKLDAVAKALARLDLDALDRAPREQAETVAGVGGRKPREMS